MTLLLLIGYQLVPQDVNASIYLHKSQKQCHNSENRPNTDIYTEIIGCALVCVKTPYIDAFGVNITINLFQLCIH